MHGHDGRFRASKSLPTSPYHISAVLGPVVEGIMHKFERYGWKEIERVQFTITTEALYAGCLMDATVRSMIALASGDANGVMVCVSSSRCESCTPATPVLH